MRSGKGLWNHGEWMFNAMMETKRKQKNKRLPTQTDIFKYGVGLRNGEDFVGYNRNTGKVIFEAENYDEARHVLDELYSV